MINLIPWRDIERKKAQFTFCLVQVSIVLLSIVLLSLTHCIIQHRIKKQNQHLTQLHAQLSNATHLVSQAKKLQDEKNRLTKEIHYFHQVHQNSTNSVLFLSELTRTTPQNIYLTNIVQKSNLIHITGYADNSTLISTFVQNLNKTNNVQQVVLSHIKQDEKIKSHHFVLQITLHQYTLLGEEHAHEMARNNL